MLLVRCAEIAADRLDALEAERDALLLRLAIGLVVGLAIGKLLTLFSQKLGRVCEGPQDALGSR